MYNADEACSWSGEHILNSLYDAMENVGVPRSRTLHKSMFEVAFVNAINSVQHASPSSSFDSVNWSLPQQHIVAINSYDIHHKCCKARKLTQLVEQKEGGEQKSEGEHIVCSPEDVQSFRDAFRIFQRYLALHSFHRICNPSLTPMTAVAETQVQDVFANFVFGFDQLTQAQRKRMVRTSINWQCGVTTGDFTNVNPHHLHAKASGMLFCGVLCSENLEEMWEVVRAAIVAQPFYLPPHTLIKQMIQTNSPRPVRSILDVFSEADKISAKNENTNDKRRTGKVPKVVEIVLRSTSTPADDQKSKEEAHHLVLEAFWMFLHVEPLTSYTAVNSYFSCNNNPAVLPDTGRVLAQLLAFIPVEDWDVRPDISTNSSYLPWRASTYRKYALARESAFGNTVHSMLTFIRNKRSKMNKFLHQTNLALVWACARHQQFVEITLLRWRLRCITHHGAKKSSDGLPRNEAGDDAATTGSSKWLCEDVITVILQFMFASHWLASPKHFFKKLKV